MSRERRWLLITETGYHTTLGRHTDPTPEEIEHAAAALIAQGMSGWLAVSEGGYYTDQPVRLMMVRSLVHGPVPWEVAAAEWERLRRHANQIIPGSPS